MMKTPRIFPCMPRSLHDNVILCPFLAIICVTTLYFILSVHISRASHLYRGSSLRHVMGFLFHMALHYHRQFRQRTHLIWNGFGREMNDHFSIYFD